MHKSSGECRRCGECCRWLPVAVVLQCKPHQLAYLRERGLREDQGYFLADAPCRHLKEQASETGGAKEFVCEIYDRRPATCREFCGKTLSGGRRFWVPEDCSMAGTREKGMGTGRKHNQDG